MQESIPKEVWIWLKDIVLYLAGAVIALLTVIWRLDRSSGNRRMTVLDDKYTALEEKVAQAITRPEVERIVEKVVQDFSKQHAGLETRMQRVEDGLKKEIHEVHDSLQGSINGIYNILTRPYNGNDRRKE